MVKMVMQNTDILIGAAGSVVIGPRLVTMAGGLVDLGEIGAIIMPLVVGAVALLVAGKAVPRGAVAFAAVQLGQAVAEAVPGLMQGE